jgi:hypothetical protein
VAANTRATRICARGCSSRRRSRRECRGSASTPSATPAPRCSSSHHDAGFTLKTYIHLIDDGLGGADFLDEALRGNKVATTDPPNPADADPLPEAESAA